MTIEDSLMDCLSTGEGNAVTQDALLRWLHSHSPETVNEIPNTRELLRLIHDMRQAGYLIASSARGYFKPSSLDEAKNYIKGMFDSRALDLLKTRSAQKRATINLFGRQSSFLHMVERKET